MKRRHTRRQGFTLLEVLLVLAILVIMGSTVSYYLIGAQKKAYTDQARSQINMFEQMLNMYHMDIGAYPNTSQGLAALREPPPELANTNKWRQYAEKDIPADPWGNPYQYEMDGDTVRIWSWGPDQQDGTEDDISNQQ